MTGPTGFLTNPPSGRRAHRIGPLVLTTTRQALGAPIIDGCVVHGDGWRAGGLAISPPAFATRHPRSPQLAIVLARVGATPPHPARWRWLPTALKRMR